MRPPTTWAGSAPAARTNSSPLSTVNHTVARQNRPGRRPSGNTSSASGKNSAIDHGQAYPNTVSSVRSTGSGHPRRAPSTSRTAADAVSVWQTAAASSSQPNGRRGRCQAISRPADRARDSDGDVGDDEGVDRLTPRQPGRVGGENRDRHLDQHHARRARRRPPSKRRRAVRRRARHRWSWWKCGRPAHALSRAPSRFAPGDRPARPGARLCRPGSAATRTWRHDHHDRHPIHDLPPAGAPPSSSPRSAR